MVVTTIIRFATTTIIYIGLLCNNDEGLFPTSLKKWRFIKLNNNMEEKEIWIDQISVESKLPYTGGNQSDLHYMSEKYNYDSNEWGTFMCWKGLGRMVNKGEKGTTIIRPIFIKTEKLDKEGNPKVKQGRRHHKVFNKSQTSIIQTKEKVELIP